MRNLIYPVLFLLFISCKDNTESTQAEIKNIQQAVYASGNIYPANEYKVFANADGFISNLKIEEGDTVILDQELMIIESDMQQARYESSEKIYDLAKTNLSNNSPAIQEYQAALSTLKQKLTIDSLNYTRFQNLYAQQACSKSDLEKASLQYVSTKNEYLAKKNGLSRLKNQLTVELKNAEAQYKVNAKDAKNYTVKSLMNGRVYDLLKEKGEAVRRNEPIATIGDYSDLKIKLIIDELDLPKLKINQKVLIKVDMFKDQVFEARLTKIYPKLNKYDQSFRADAVFVNAKLPDLYGLSLEANIIIDQKQNALCIPKNYLVSNDSLWIELNNEKTKIKIKKGVEDFDYVEIIEGITKDTKVYKP